MTINVGKMISHSASSVGKTITQPYRDVKSVVEDVGKAGSQVYKDGRSAVSYTGKHLINDVDNLSSALTSPMLWIVVGGVVVILLVNR